MTGVSDLNNLHKHHELSYSHIASLIALKQFGKTRIEYVLSEQYKINIEKQNKAVKQNGYIVRYFKIIDVFERFK